VSPRARPAVRGRARRTRDPADKRARLMEAAAALFAQRGYAATTTADVARHAGVSEGIVFHHFGSKADLLEAVAADYGQGLAQAMFAVAPPPGQPPSAEPMLRAAFGYAREHGAVARLLRLSAPDGETRGARRASRGQIVGALARGFARWSAAGVRPADGCADRGRARVRAGRGGHRRVLRARRRRARGRLPARSRRLRRRRIDAEEIPRVSTPDYRSVRQNPWWIPPFLGGVPQGVGPAHLRVLGFVTLAMFFENYDLGMLGNALPQIAATYGPTRWTSAGSPASRDSARCRRSSCCRWEIASAGGGCS
jgi:AcrR family transcriptional regulator